MKTTIIYRTIFVTLLVLTSMSAQAQTNNDYIQQGERIRQQQEFEQMQRYQRQQQQEAQQENLRQAQEEGRRQMQQMQQQPYQNNNTIYR